MSSRKRQSDNEKKMWKHIPRELRNQWKAAIPVCPNSRTHSPMVNLGIRDPANVALGSWVVSRHVLRTQRAVNSFCLLQCFGGGCAGEKFPNDMQLPAEKREEIRQAIVAKRLSVTPAYQSSASRKRKTYDSSSPAPATPTPSKRYRPNSSSPVPVPSSDNELPPSSTPALSSSPPLSIIDAIDCKTQLDADHKLAEDLQNAFTNEHIERVAGEIGVPISQLYEGDLANTTQSSLLMSKAALQYIKAKRPLSRKISTLMGIAKTPVSGSGSSRGGEFSR